MFCCLRDALITTARSKMLKCCEGWRAVKGRGKSGVKMFLSTRPLRIRVWCFLGCFVDVLALPFDRMDPCNKALPTYESLHHSSSVGA